ncbi:MAG: hypothetical protein LBQ32_06400, partial [Burkholderiaceae bacterium]|nr:hypothetical protein [Burkholderiaceae bacterium]
MIHAERIPPSPTLRLSTAHLPEKDRLPYWREVVGRHICGLDIEPLADATGHFGMTLSNLGGFTMICGDGLRQGAHYRRTRALIAADGNDDMILMIALAGSVVGTQRGREIVMAQGEAVLASAGEAGWVTLPHMARLLTLRMPWRLLKPAAPALEERIARHIARENPALRLLTNYAEAWQQDELPATPELRQMFVSHMHDLFALVAGASGDAAELAAQHGGRAARLAQIRHEIKQSALDPDFSLPALAQRVGVTPRYVQMLLEEG